MIGSIILRLHKDFLCHPTVFIPKSPCELLLQCEMKAVTYNRGGDLRITYEGNSAMIQYEKFDVVSTL